MAPSPTTARLSYQPGLDGLRALAVLAVFGFHAAEDLVPGGYLGVNVFFVLSGFLITLLLLQERARDDRINLLAFYRRRALRLYPALVLGVALTALIASINGSSPADIGAWAASALTYTTNVLAATRTLPDGNVLGHTWSLAVEEQFYLVWPLVLIGLTRIVRPSLVHLLVGCVLAGVVVRAVAGATMTRGNVYILPLGHLDELLIGALFAVLVFQRHPIARAIGTTRAAAVGAIGLLVGAFAAASAYDMRWLNAGGGAVLACAIVVLIGHTLNAPSSALTKTLSSPPAAWLGRRSYGFYLFHSPIIFFCHETLGLQIRVLAPVALLSTLAAAGLSYRFVELPFLRRKYRVRRLGLARRSVATGDASA